MIRITYKQLIKLIKMAGEKLGKKVQKEKEKIS